MWMSEWGNVNINVNEWMNKCEHLMWMSKCEYDLRECENERIREWVNNWV